MEKGKQHTAEIIEAGTAKDAKKAYIAKNNLGIKIYALSANIKLGLTQDRIDEVARARRSKDDAVARKMNIPHDDMLKRMMAGDK